MVELLKWIHLEYPTKMSPFVVGEKKQFISYKLLTTFISIMETVTKNFFSPFFRFNLLELAGHRDVYI